MSELFNFEILIVTKHKIKTKMKKYLYLYFKNINCCKKDVLNFK